MMRHKQATCVSVLLILALIACRSSSEVSTASGSEGAILDTGLDDVSSSGWEHVAAAHQFLTGIQCLAGSDVCYVVGSDTVLETGDGGETWSTLDPGLPSGSGPRLTCTDDSTCYVAGVASTPDGDLAAIVRTQNGGQTWMTVHTAEVDTSLHDLHCPLDSGVCFAVTTVDRGLRCSIEDVGCLLKSLVRLLLRRPQSVLTLLKTTDGGDTWSSVYTENETVMRSLQCPVDSDTCYALRAGYSFIGGGTVVKSTNGGKSWSRMYGEGNAFLRGLACPDQDTCYVVGYYDTDADPPLGSFIIKTGDGGKRWSRVISGLEPPRLGSTAGTS